MTSRTDGTPLTSDERTRLSRAVGRPSGPDIDDVLSWLKAQDRAVRISGGTPGAMWQVRVTRPIEHHEHVPWGRSRNALRLTDAVLRAGLDVLDEVVP